MDNVYKINFSALVDQKVVCLLSVNDKKWVWHKRLGHANWRLISKLSKLQLVKGLPDIDYHSDALCGACQKGKIVKTSFKTKDIVSTSRPLELLHIDLFGPVTTESLYGSKYGVVIVDDYNRWTWVKFLRSKDCAYDVSGSFCTQIQSEKEMKKAYLKKFDAKAQKGIFLRYSERSNAYKVYNSETLCVEESMHVKFDDKELGNETPEQAESFADIQDSEDTPEPDQIDASEVSPEAVPTLEA